MEVSMGKTFHSYPNYVPFLCQEFCSRVAPKWFTWFTPGVGSTQLTCNWLLEIPLLIG